LVKQANIPQKTEQPRSPSHMPENSFFFEKLIPTFLMVMAVITVGLILFALSVLFGLVNF
jgi:hypothetical protein